MNRAARVFTCLVAVLALSAASAPTAAAASCSATPTSGNESGGYNLVIPVSCDSPVTGGSISIAMNRGITDVDASPAISDGSGALSCTGRQEAPGSEYESVLECTGSLTTSAKATLRALVAPNPCVSPAFLSSLTVAFGDGSSFGPQAPLKLNGCSGGGAEGPPRGRNFDPGGVFLGTLSKPPRRASVTEARRGLEFALRLGVKGRVVVTIEVKARSVGRTVTKTKGGRTALLARLGRKAARRLRDKRTRARIHVHVIPHPDEGLAETGEKYFRLRLKPARRS